MKISQQELKTFLKYDPDTGLFTWLPRINSPQWNAKFQGEVAGTVQVKGNGYRRVVIGINGKFFRAHRLAWLYMTGEEPPAEIDHRNRDATDNRWINIRDSEGLNQKNKSMQRNNKSGVTGVSWSKAAGKWTARVWEGAKGARQYRHLGLFETVDAAKVVVEAFRKGLYDAEHGMYRPVYAVEASHALAE